MVSHFEVLDIELHQGVIWCINYECQCSSTRKIFMQSPRVSSELLGGPGELYAGEGGAGSDSKVRTTIGMKEQPHVCINKPESNRFPIPLINSLTFFPLNNKGTISTLRSGVNVQKKVTEQTERRPLLSSM